MCLHGSFSQDHLTSPFDNSLFITFLCGNFCQGLLGYQSTLFLAWYFLSCYLMSPIAKMHFLLWKNSLCLEHLASIHHHLSIWQDDTFSFLFCILSLSYSKGNGIKQSLILHSWTYNLLTNWALQETEKSINQHQQHTQIKIHD